jgi:3-oxoadipate enol-lactonase
MLLPLAGRRLYYDLVGPENGPVVCFTHSLASDSGMWAEQIPPLLAAGFRVLRIDMRGHGGSNAAAGDYAMEHLAGDVAAVIDALAIRQVHYIGLSIGGMIGQAFALAYGDRVTSLMLCDTSPASPPDAKATWAPRIDAATKANSLAPLADATMERWFTKAFQRREPGRWAQIRDTIIGTSVGGYLGCTAAILNFDFVARLPTLKLPALVVCGADDQGTPPEANKRIAALVPGARYEEIADARHLPNVEQPATFNAVMTSWLGAHR